MAQDIRFKGIAAPVRVEGAGPVLALLPEVATGWPVEIADADPTARPFFSIRAEPDGGRFLCETHVEDKAPRRLDALNALCDLAAALSLAWPAADDRLICLHAAAVEIGGRLVVFPNIRRAGKSTLSAALARAGHALFSDDVLPVSFGAEGRARGHAMGIAPRLRLPLPDALPQAFRDWAAANPGPENGQYKYLSLPGQPPNDATLEVGAFVILDRQDDPVPAVLAPVTPDAAMDVLLHQNFTRDRHSADILASVAAMLRGCPTMRLSYSELDKAADVLGATFRTWPEPPAPEPGGPDLRFRMADFRGGPRPVPGPGDRIRRRAGTAAEAIGDTLYLSDAEGRAIHRMDPLAAAIWDLLEDPSTEAELGEILAGAFPDTPAERIASDLRALVARLAQSGLVEAEAPA